MAVDVRGHLDVRVSQPLLHVLQPVALRQQHAGAGVAQVVESDVGQVVLLQQLVEGVAHIVGGVGVPVLPGEYVVVVYVVLAEVVAVVLFLLKQDLEQPYRIVCQGKAAEAGCVFRLVLLHDLRDPGHGVPFAIKATHGCKMNYLVPDKSKFDSEKCKKEIQRWMDTTYGTYSMEPHYIEIPHRFYIEKYLEKADQLVDYKFHCLNGEPQFVLTCSDRKSNGNKAMQVTLDLFDMDWKPIPEIVSSGLERPGDGKLPRPENLDEMIRIAKILSEDFKFVRVDLYELEGKVYFGELTFSPAHCVFPYLSDKFDLEMGKLLQI